MVKTQEKSRQRIAADHMTEVQRLRQRLSSGAVKSELRTVSEAVSAARALYKQIELARIPAKDFFVHVGYVGLDLSMLNTEPFTPGHEAALQAKLSHEGMCCIVALVFGLRDWERKEWSLGARLFLRTPLVETVVKQWLAEMYILNTEARKT